MDKQINPSISVVGLHKLRTIPGNLLTSYLVIFVEKSIVDICFLFSSDYLLPIRLQTQGTWVRYISGFIIQKGSFLDTAQDVEMMMEPCRLTKRNWLFHPALDIIAN